MKAIYKQYKTQTILADRHSRRHSHKPRIKKVLFYSRQGRQEEWRAPPLAPLAGPPYPLPPPPPTPALLIIRFLVACYTSNATLPHFVHLFIHWSVNLSFHLIFTFLILWPKWSSDLRYGSCLPMTGLNWKLYVLYLWKIWYLRINNKQMLIWS